MSDNIESLIMTFLFTVICYGGIGLAIQWRFKKFSDKYDSSNETVKGIQGWMLKWGGIMIFLVFWLPLINLAMVFIYTIKREVMNHEVIEMTYWHVLDIIIYNWKIVGWLFIWMAILFVKLIQAVANIFNMNWNILSIKDVPNQLHDSWYFSWNAAFIISTLLWTWIKSDDKWPFGLRWAAYIGSVIIPAIICGNFVFIQSFPKLPVSDTLTYLWTKSISKNTSLNDAEGTTNAAAGNQADSGAMRPAEYGMDGTVATSETGGFMGYPWLWWIIGAIILIVLILIFLKLRGKKNPAAAAGGDGEKKSTQEGGATASGGDRGDRKEEGERQEKKVYAQADYGNDLNLVRYDIRLFEKYETSPYWCLDKATYQDRVDRMRNYVFSLGAKARTDPFIPDDHEALTAEMQRLIMADSLGRIPFDFSRIRTDYSDDAHGIWAGVVGEILSAASEGFFLLGGEYGNIIRGLGEQYMRSLADAANLTTERIRAANNTDQKSPDHQELGRIKQRILNVQSWVGALQGAYSKTGYKIPTPGMPQMQEGPGWFSVAYARNPKQFLITIGVILLLLILAMFFLFRGGGSKISSEEKAYYTEQMQTNMTIFVGYVCGGGDPSAVLKYDPSVKKGSKKLRAAVAAYERVQDAAKALDWDQEKTLQYYNAEKQKQCPQK